VRRSVLSRWHTSAAGRSAFLLAAEAAGEDERAGLVLHGASDRHADTVWTYQVGSAGSAPEPMAVGEAAAEVHALDMVGGSVGLAERPMRLAVPLGRKLRVQLERLRVQVGARDELLTGLHPMFAAARDDPSMPVYLAHTSVSEDDEVWVLVVFEAGMPGTEATAAARRDVADRITPLLASSDVWRFEILGGTT
jgi:hypothetical protein